MELTAPLNVFDPGSLNFRAAKVGSMLLVVIGHFYNGWWWVPVLFGLWVFAFSSGLFSASRYRRGIGYREYLTPKLLRLLVPLLTAQAVVVLACVWQGRTNLFNLDSLFALVGLTRVSAWIGVEKLGPLGNGLWFLNLLWLFYLSLPLMVPLLGHRLLGWFAGGAAFIAAVALENRCWQGVFFFATAFAFIFGALVGMQRRWFTVAGLGLVIAGMVAVVAGFSLASGGAIMDASWLMAVSPVICHILLQVRLPLDGISTLLQKCDPLFLPVYVIHTYFFVGHHAAEHWARHGGFLASLASISAVSWMLSRLNARLRPA